MEVSGKVVCSSTGFLGVGSLWGGVPGDEARVRDRAASYTAKTKGLV